MRKQAAKQEQELWNAFHAEIAADAIAIASENPMISGFFERMSASQKEAELQKEGSRKQRSKTFAQSVSDADLIFARGMGISLD